MTRTDVSGHPLTASDRPVLLSPLQRMLVGIWQATLSPLSYTEQKLTFPLQLPSLLLPSGLKDRTFAHTPVT